MKDTLHMQDAFAQNRPEQPTIPTFADLSFEVGGVHRVRLSDPSRSRVARNAAQRRTPNIIDLETCAIVFCLADLRNGYLFQLYSADKASFLLNHPPESVVPGREVEHLTFNFKLMELFPCGLWKTKTVHCPSVERRITDPIEKAYRPGLFNPKYVSPNEIDMLLGAAANLPPTRFAQTGPKLLARLRTCVV